MIKLLFILHTYLLYKHYPSIHATQTNERQTFEQIGGYDERHKE